MICKFSNLALLNISGLMILKRPQIDYNQSHSICKENEVLSPADDVYHINKRNFEVPFVCGAKDLGEALRRINEQEIELLMAERGK